MFHGQVFLNALQQSGPSGADKVFSTNWFMPMAQTQLGPGTFTARVMLSLEPGTITPRYYPELLQQGETAFGKPIVNGQHPHDFIMELATLYDLKIGEQALLSFYFAPMGDPAMGPTAYPHRASASENPIAPLGHHLEDSTHVSDDVITAGFTYKRARIEASGFHGREPDEFRWDIDSGKVHSWSIRAHLKSRAKLECAILYRPSHQPRSPSSCRGPAEVGCRRIMAPPCVGDRTPAPIVAPRASDRNTTNAP